MEVQGLTGSTRSSSLHCSAAMVPPANLRGARSNHVQPAQIGVPILHLVLEEEFDAASSKIRCPEKQVTILLHRPQIQAWVRLWAFQVFSLPPGRWEWPHEGGVKLCMKDMPLPVETLS